MDNFDELKEEVNTSRKDPTEMDLFELLEQHTQNFSEKQALVQSIVQNAKEGDSQALKMLERALLEGKYKKEQNEIITDAQLYHVITLAADRYRGQNSLTPAETADAN